MHHDKFYLSADRAFWFVYC